MGVIGSILGAVQALADGERNVLRDTVEVFRENAEAGAVREADLRAGALSQFAAEFGASSGAAASGVRAGPFDRVMDAVNRLPRPALALGTLGLFTSAMVDPLWFAARMQGLALVPEPLWWLLGVVVSFYFGARYQVKHQAFQRDIARTLAQAPQVAGAITALRALRHDSPGVADTAAAAQTLAAVEPEVNPALEAWRQLRRG